MARAFEFSDSVKGCKGIKKKLDNLFRNYELLETFVKNCNDRFHYEIGSKAFMDTLLKLLKRVNKK